MSFRVGLGTDIHRLQEGLPLLLAGVRIDHSHGLVGHSDADIVLHAVTDALLGAAGLGDIGEWFPDTDPQWKGADSSLFLTETVKALREGNWAIGNLDIVIHAQKPKLLHYKPTMKQNLSRWLQIEESSINLKAKTGEQVGPVGRGEAMEASVIALIYQTET